jgi:hypothetical protein
MPYPYKRESSDEKTNAQRNLSGRSHYADDATLRYHKARILSTHITDKGLLFALTESVALDPQGLRRGFRFVVFDIFGHVVERADLESCWRTHDAARKAMWDFLNGADAKALTLSAIEREERHFAGDMAHLRQVVSELSEQEKRALPDA